MLADGIVDETRSLLEMGYTGNEQALQTVGYREVIQFLRGEIDESRMISDIKMNTRRYAKRQATWFRRWKSANFIDVSGEETAQITRNLISQFKLPF
jgi:tRNA dimethylallyltransferase